MLHLRIVTPSETAQSTLELLCGSASVCNVVHLPGAARRPDGDVVLCDVAREDASVILSDLRELDIPSQGSIAIDEIDTQISDAADRAEEAAAGVPADAVVWEEVEFRTSEEAALSVVFLTFMVLAMLIAMSGIFLDTPILIVGAMVVGPEFGPIAGVCVALVERQGKLALQSGLALLVGFPLGIVATLLVALAFRALGITPGDFDPDEQTLSKIIANPDFFTFFVAFCAGVVGILSLSTAKSGALIGVLISVTTIPAAANIGVTVAYGDWGSAGGSLGQLAINLSTILLAGTLVLWLQRRLYRRRRREHLRDPVRAAAGLPLGRSRRQRSRVSGFLRRAGR